MRPFQSFHFFHRYRLWHLWRLCSFLGIAGWAHAAGSALDQRQWRLVETNNEETSGTPQFLARYAFDGNAGTFCHTRWRTAAARSDHPHYLIIDLGKIFRKESS